MSKPTHKPLLIKNFTSGGQLSMHSIRMFLQAARSILFFALLIFFVLWIGLFLYKTSFYDLYLVFEYPQIYFKSLWHSDSALEAVRDVDREWIQMTIRQFLEHPYILQSLESSLDRLASTFYEALMGASVSLISLAFLFYLHGKRKRAIQEITGQTRVQDKVLRKLLNKQGKASDLRVADVPLLKDAEVQHILLTGTTGTGKTLCLQELMDQVRAKKQRAIIYDIEGTFIPHYYREGKDVILNPLDARCTAWNIWQEGHKASDFESMASSLMPLHLAGTDPFWIHSARTIFSCAAQRLQALDRKTMNDLLLPLFSEQLGSLFKLVENSPAESLVSEKNEKTALSIKATLSTYCKALMYLRDESGPLFSIGRWIQDEEQDSWLFIASDAQKVEALKPLISVWLDVAAKAVLSLEPSSKRRLWFMMDELPSLHRLPSFMNTLARGRKYGSCFVAAIQDIHQLRSIYGRDEAETLTALFNTNICYRTKCPDSAHWMSKVMGALEVLENREGYSYGAHDMRDGVSIQPERRREPVVKEGEFLELDDLHAFLRLPGNWPVTDLTFIPKTREIIAPSLVEADLKESLLFESTAPLEIDHSGKSDATSSGSSGHSSESPVNQAQNPKAKSRSQSKKRRKQSLKPHSEDVLEVQWPKD
jgi:type IV conjugative transfer system coupling protein TraD